MEIRQSVMASNAMASCRKSMTRAFHGLPEGVAHAPRALFRPLKHAVEKRLFFDFYLTYIWL
jgi:hypothetical protein